MNYHLMIDDKFIDGFIKDAETAAPNKNTYIFTFNASPQYVKSETGIYAPYGSEKFREIIQQVKIGDKVFVHWLHDAAARAILELPKEIGVGAFFWGGDFLEDPIYFHKKNLLGPLSLKLYNSRFEYPIFVSKNPITLVKRIRYKYWKLKKFQTQRRDLKRKAVQRLDHLFHWNMLDHKEVEDLYGTKIEPLYFHYDAGVDREFDALSNPYVSKKKKTTILLGNSSSITNNHLEAIEFLSQYKNEDVEIYCPLSYGDEGYGDIIQKKGEKIFRSKFIAVRKFMDRKDYYCLLNDVDVVFMNHRRTQAAGNIMAFLKMGKKIYMKPESTLFQLLEGSGIKIFTVSGSRFDFDEFVAPLDQETTTANYKRMKKIFSEQRRRSTLESL